MWYRNLLHLIKMYGLYSLNNLIDYIHIEKTILLGFM